MIVSMRRFLSVAAASCIVVTSGLVGAGAAHAEGPGYGGNAGDLTVKWTETSEAISAAPPDVPGQGETGPDPNKIGLQDANQALTILGMGFRASTAVRIQVGDIANVERKSDQTGDARLRRTGRRSGAGCPGCQRARDWTFAVGYHPHIGGVGAAQTVRVGPQNIIPWIAGVFAVGVRWRMRGRGHANGGRRRGLRSPYRRRSNPERRPVWLPVQPARRCRNTVAAAASASNRIGSRTAAPATS